MALLFVFSSFTFVKGEEKPVLRVLTEYSNTDLNADPTAKLLEELTGYSVQYDALPNEERLTKLNAILAAREPYDIMILAPDAFSDMAHMGAFMPLDDLLAEEGQSVLAGTNPLLWTSTTIDGKVLGVPYRLSVENYNSGLRVRTDLLQKIGIAEMPKTPEALYDMLLKAKNELNIIPLTGVGVSNDVFVSEIASAFGLYSNWIVTEEGVVNRITSKGAKDYVAFMNTLYSQGLLDAEWAQNSSAAAREKFLSGQALINRVYWWEEPSASTTLLQNFPDATADYLPPLAGEYGEGVFVNRSADRIVVIPKMAKNPQLAMEWMNTKMSTPETFRTLCIGTEGTHYTVLGENEYAPINPAFTDEKGFASEFLTGTIASDYDIYWSQTRVRKNEQLYQEFLKMQENIASAKIYYDPTSFMPPDAEFIQLSPTLNTFVYDTVLQMIVGTRSIDEWDAFVEEYYSAGGKELETLLNQWWDANKETLQDKVYR